MATITYTIEELIAHKEKGVPEAALKKLEKNALLIVNLIGCCLRMFSKGIVKQLVRVFRRHFLNL